MNSPPIAPFPGTRFEPRIPGHASGANNTFPSFQEIVDSLSTEQSNEALQQLRQMLRQHQKSADREPMAWILLHMAMVMRGALEDCQAQP